MTTLTLGALQKLVGGDGVALRVRQKLQPAGGNGDKVFPPTYATGADRLKYATETRRAGGVDVKVVLLDSVASQANRMEEALLAAWESKRLDFPVIPVDFSSDADLADIGSITSLHAPHRIADAILRDATSADGKQLFRDTDDGKAFTQATYKDATAVYRLCPTALIFGVWDSTGPKGGMGAKFQRALTSEIVAVGMQSGSKVGSRIDPLAIEKVPIYATEDGSWTALESEAKKDGKKPALYARKDGEKEQGRPSLLNHGNVTPSVDEFAGGVTFDHALQTVVLSLPALRRLRFVKGTGGKPLGENRPAAEDSARVALAALALAAIVHQRAQGYDLRSRCLLVPESAFELDLVYADGKTEVVTLTVDEADQLVGQAHAAANQMGLGWEREPIRLKASPKLMALVKKSRAEAAAEAE